LNYEEHSREAGRRDEEIGFGKLTAEIVEEDMPTLTSHQNGDWGKGFLGGEGTPKTGDRVQKFVRK